MLAAAALAAYPSASAPVTTWTAPTGGSWHDPANWSAGVPTTGDTAVLPTLVSGPYEISVASDSAFKSLVVNGDVTLAGQGTITTSDGTDVGVGASTHGSLTLEGVDLHAGSLFRVGFDGGVGELMLNGSSSDVVANLVFIGLTGTATTEIEPTNSLTGAYTAFGLTSTLKLLVAPGMQPVLAAGQTTLGGALEVTFTPNFPLPILAGIPLAAPGSIYSGAFSSITSPEAYGQHVPVQQFGMIVGPFDPIIGMTIEPIAPSAYVGFAESLAARITRLSGATSSICCSGSASASALTTWSIEPAELAVIEEDYNARRLRGLAPGDITLTLSYPQYGATLTTTKPMVVLANTGPVIEAVDVGPNGEEPDGAVWGGYGQTAGTTTVRSSADGRFVAFADDSTTFAAFDPSPDLSDVFVKDRSTGGIEMVSAAALSPGVPASSGDVDISADGRYVTFAVFPWPQGSGVVQLWLSDRQNGTTTLISRTPSGAPGNGDSYQGRISADGSVVVFTSAAADLVARDTNGKADVFAYDLASGAISRVSVAADGAQFEGASASPAVSGDGRFVAFQSVGDFGSGSAYQIVVKDRVTGRTELASVSSSGALGNGLSSSPAIDGSGQVVAFRTTSTNLGASVGGYKLFARDRVSGTTTLVYPLVPPPLYPSTCANSVQNPCISADGRFVAFEAYKAYRLGAHDYFGCSIVRFDRSTGQSEFAAVTPWQTAVPGYVSTPALSANGGTAFFVAKPETMLPYGEDVKSILFARTFGAANSPDLDGDGFVGPRDLGILLGAWGSSGPGDLDADGIVGPTDIAVLLGSWS